MQGEISIQDQQQARPSIDEAVYFDGTSNQKHRVTLRLDTGLDIVEDGNVAAHWPFDAIRRADSPQGLLRLRCTSARPLARLEIADATTIASLLRLCLSLDADRGGPAHTRRIVAWSVAAICSILVVVIYGIPYAADRLAPLVPFAIEKRIGEAVDTQVRAILGGKECVSAEGQAAYAKLVGKLKAAGGIDLPIDARVLSHEMANALALPGGKVYLIDGLLQKARNVDEVAGVLAHEIGHVIHRDSLRRVIQAGGTSFLVGLLLGDVFGGGAIIFVAQTMLEASYSRDAEQQADAFAIEVMQKLGRSPRPLGELLVRITGSEVKEAKDAKDAKDGKRRGKKGRGFTLINSHPLTQDRLDMMKKVDRGNTGPELLTASEWRALRSICAAK
jgi:Zn-dependent protease with chaperone function